MDIWKVGIVRRSVKDILVEGFEGAAVQWLEEQRPFCFLADPFGVWRKDNLAVFAEAYDYRSRLGRIDAFLFDKDLRLMERRTCLSERWHLSYPFLFEMRGELWMLPEAHRSGRLTLYRNHDFPFGWKREMTICVPEPAVDATVTFHDGLWWLFYSPAERSAPARLHAAFAKDIAGPWFQHPANPLVVGGVGSRPGGTPFSSAEGLMVPAQNSQGGYGNGINMLTFGKLSPDVIELRISASLISPMTPPFDAGLHTLSAAGEVTLIDVKRNELGLNRLPIDALGRFRRAYRGWFQH